MILLAQSLQPQSLLLSLHGMVTVKVNMGITEPQFFCKKLFLSLQLLTFLF